MKFEIRCNDVPRTYRDVKAVAYEAALYIKMRHLRDIVEIVDLATGEKVQMRADGNAA